MPADDLADPVDRSLAAGSQLALIQDQLFGPGVSRIWPLGWTMVDSSTPRLAGFFMTFNGSLSVLDGAGILSEPAQLVHSAGDRRPRLYDASAFEPPPIRSGDHHRSREDRRDCPEQRPDDYSRLGGVLRGRCDRDVRRAGHRSLGLCSGSSRRRDCSRTSSSATSPVTSPFLRARISASAAGFFIRRNTPWEGDMHPRCR